MDLNIRVELEQSLILKQVKDQLEGAKYNIEPDAYIAMILELQRQLFVYKNIVKDFAKEQINGDFDQITGKLQDLI